MDVFTKLKGIFWETCSTSCWVLLLGVGYTPPKTFFVSFAFRDLGFKLIAFRLVFFMVKLSLFLFLGIILQFFEKV